MVFSVQLFHSVSSGLPGRDRTFATKFRKLGAESIGREIGVMGENRTHVTWATTKHSTIELPPHSVWATGIEPAGNVHPKHAANHLPSPRFTGCVLPLDDGLPLGKPTGLEPVFHPSCRELGSNQFCGLFRPVQSPDLLSLRWSRGGLVQSSLAVHRAGIEPSVVGLKGQQSDH